ncbi:MAG: WecB/TagA/CpsF family glycosyltransferase [Patescibacteria group bacterium]
MINILGIKIDKIKKAEVLKKIEQFLASKKAHYIVTPNPEIILQSMKDEELFYVLNNADLSIPDGFGLKIAALAMGKKIYRFTGADLVKELIENKKFKNLKIGILNWNQSLSKKEDLIFLLTKCKIQNKVIDIDNNFKEIPQAMIEFSPEILFLNLGAPYQEKYIYHYYQKIPNLKLAIGVGGAFDFLTGKIKRAPKLMQILGLEWLWRLFKQPWRLARIKNAVIVFPIKFIRWRFIRSFFYRPNVVCLLYKKENNIFKILLLERVDQPGHWQIPQGGIDKENLITAGKRELEEEVGSNKFKVIKILKSVYRYKFTENNTCAGISSRLVHGYKGQKQSLLIAEFFGSDKDIKINFWDHSNWKWVDCDKVVNEVHELRQKGTKIFIQKFNNLQINKSSANWRNK